MVICSKSSTPTPILQFSQGAQFCGTGLSPPRAMVRDLGPTLPGSLEVSYGANIKKSHVLTITIYKIK